MNLILILLFFIYVAFSVRISVLKILDPVTTLTHQFCLKLLPTDLQNMSELKALACGHNFTTLGETYLYINSGLIHLFVVSGAHFIVLSQIVSPTLTHFKIKPIYLLILLVLYGFLCELNPPVVRALIQIILTHYLNSKNINWPNNYKIFVCGLLTISLDPNLIKSFSLQLSWLAAFSVINTKKLNSDFLKSQILFTLFMLPALLFIQTPSPLIVLCNIVFGPILEVILFPLSLGVIIIPKLGTFFDFLINNLKTILTFLEFNNVKPASSYAAFQNTFIWLYIFILHLFFYYQHLKEKTRQ